MQLLTRKRDGWKLFFLKAILEFVCERIYVCVCGLTINTVITNTKEEFTTK